MKVGLQSSDESEDDSYLTDKGDTTYDCIEVAN